MLSSDSTPGPRAAAAEQASSKDAARQQITHALTVAARSVLADIDAAVDRLQIGTYGNCEHCGAAILRTSGDLADGQALHALPRHENLP